MKHKFSTTPSIGFIRAKLRKYIGQRATFKLSPDCYWWRLLTAEQFDPNEPIFVNGIFTFVWKRREKWPKSDGKITFFLEFRDVLFRQGNLEAMPLAATRRYNKRMQISFRADDIELPDYLAVCELPAIGFSGDGGRID